WAGRACWRKGRLFGTSSATIAYHTGSLPLAGRDGVPAHGMGQPDALDEHEHDGEAEHSEQLELDPESFAEGVGDVQVHGTDHDEERHPDEIEACPLVPRERHDGAHDPLYDRLLPDPVTAEEHERDRPVQHGRLPFQEIRVPEEQRGRTEYQHENSGRQVNL